MMQAKIEEFTKAVNSAVEGAGPEELRVLLGRALAKLLEPHSTPITWEAHRTYTREETIAYWRISPNTLLKWQNDGLPVLNLGTKEIHYYGQDVIDFTRSKVAPTSHQHRGASKKTGKQGKT